LFLTLAEDSAAHEIYVCKQGVAAKKGLTKIRAEKNIKI